jgi:hypothetical protein
MVMMPDLDAAHAGEKFLPFFLGARLGEIVIGTNRPGSQRHRQLPDGIAYFCCWLLFATAALD